MTNSTDVFLQIAIKWGESDKKEKGCLTDLKKYQGVTRLSGVTGVTKLAGMSKEEEEGGGEEEKGSLNMAGQ